MNVVELHDDLVGVWLPRSLMIRCAGNARDAVVLASLSYWLQPQRDGSPRTVQSVMEDGSRWLYITDDELGAEIGISQDAVFRARQSLKDRGLIESQRVRYGDVMVNRVRVLGLGATA